MVLVSGSSRVVARPLQKTTQEVPHQIGCGPGPFIIIEHLAFDRCVLDVYFSSGLCGSRWGLNLKSCIRIIYLDARSKPILGTRSTGGALDLTSVLSSTFQTLLVKLE